MPRNLTWSIIKQVLVHNLETTNTILTFGTIGSLNIEKDIDIIITKKKGSSTSDFYREIHGLFDALRDVLNTKYKKKLIVFNKGGVSPEQLKLSSYEKGDVVLDVMSYVSLHEAEGHWEPYMFRGESFSQLLRTQYDCIIGKTDDVFSKNFPKEISHDSIYLLLSGYDLIHSNYEPGFLIEAMNTNFDFILRKRLGLKSLKATNERKVRELFYKICDIVDKLASS